MSERHAPATADPSGREHDKRLQPERFLAYCRVSTGEQATHGTSLVSQRKRLRGLAVSEGWPEPRFFVDDGVSGKEADRPELGRLLASLRPNDIVAVTAIDRLARKLRLLLDIVERVQQAGAFFRSIREGWDTSTSMGRFGLQLVGATAELERELIAERTSEGRRQRQAEGKWAGGKPPFGYRRRRDGYLEIVPAEAEVVRAIFALYTGERLGVLRLQSELIRQGLKSPKGNLHWSQSSLHALLSDPVYVGRHALGLSVPAIIEESMWKRAQDRRRTNKPVRPRRARPWPLQGRMVCASCGSSWYANSGKGGRTYFCVGRENRSGYALRTGQRCAIPRQPADDLERRIWDALCDALTNPKSFKKAIDTAVEQLRARADELERGVGPVRAALVEVRDQRSRILDRYVQMHMPQHDLEKRAREIDRREAELESHLAAIDPDLEEKLEHTQLLIAGAEDLRDTMDYRSVHGMRVGEFSLLPGVAETEAIDEFRGESGWPILKRDVPDVTAALTEALDRLHAEISVKEDHAEVRGLIRFDALLPTPTERDPQLYGSPRRSG